MGILTACEPRQDIITGAFNPEIFTASLSEVLSHYREGTAGVHAVYTDAELFFSEATYPTDGMKTILAEVFARLAGDNSVPAIHRLETAFGGGKTHTLIACTHIAFKGTDLTKVTTDILAPSLLPSPGETAVVGIAGDSIPVNKPQGDRLIPYTLWGEIAFQVGGKSLYEQVGEDAASPAAPGEYYFETVLKGRKVLIMLDELAQYAARLAAAHPGGADQLAAFLMSLHGYARRNPAIAIVLTLASATDAFASQTNELAKILTEVTGKDIDQDDALAIAQEALKDGASVVARDATGMVPVQAAEISRVLGKRLFTHIDQGTADQTAREYGELYTKNKSLLPEQATSDNYQDRMISHYPFHPTLIDFLNDKLATAENFQGTRGVLRVLALAVRRIWHRKQDTPMIHTCHLDLRDARTVTEIISRTGSGELLPILNADIGGVDTQGIEGGKSNAELADIANPQPQGWPMHEYTWKTIFLHSLVGRVEGLSSNLFGLNEQDALFSVSFPGLPPAQIGTALQKIKDNAYYLRSKQGRFYASLDASINIVLAGIRKNLTQEEVDQLLNTSARKVVSADIRTFTVVHDVAAPEHIPDKQGKPVLAIVSLQAEDVDVMECVTTAGLNTPRLEQNLVFLLIPDTVLTSDASGTLSLFGGAASQALQAMDELRELARTVLAMKKLKQQPDSYGISRVKLDQDDFKKRFSKREFGLITAVTLSYKALWFPSASGQIIRKEIRTAGGESGASVLEQIRKVLLADGELVTSDHAGKSDLQSLAKLFFTRTDTASLSKLRKNFCQIRSWPILDSPEILEQLVRAGVSRGQWCLFLMGEDDATKPAELYSQDTDEVPLNLDLQRDYSLISMKGARQRGWLSADGPDLGKVKDWVLDELRSQQAVSVASLVEGIAEKHGEIPKASITENLTELLKTEKAVAYQGEVEQEEKPNQIYWGADAVLYSPKDDDIIIIPSQAAVRGWLKQPGGEYPGVRTAQPAIFKLSGSHGANKILPLLPKIGSLYNRGAKSTIATLDITDLKLPRGGRLRIAIDGVAPDSMKDLGELMEVIADLVEQDSSTEVYLEINNPQDDCVLLQELNKKS